MKHQEALVIFAVLVFALLPLVSAELTFKKSDSVNYRFRCLEENNTYCGSSRSLYISIEGPNGSNIYDSSAMTYNPTYFNHTLPTNELGEYRCLIVSPQVNWTEDCSYLVTVSGNPRLNTGEGLINIGGIIIIIAVAAFFFIVGIGVENLGMRVVMVGNAAIVLIIGILYTMLSIDQMLGSFTAIVGGYSTFWFVMKIFIGLAVTGLLIAALLLSYNVWMIKRGFKD